MSEPSTLPPRPDLLAELVVTSGGSSQQVILTGLRVWHQASLPGAAEGHMDPTSTALAPRVGPGDGTVLWLVGYRLGTLEAEGDTLVTFSLLLNLSPSSTPGTVKALWYEDHMEIPHRYYVGSGGIEAAEARGVVRLALDLVDAEHGDELEITGLLRSR